MAFKNARSLGFHQSVKAIQLGYGDTFRFPGKNKHYRYVGYDRNKVTYKSIGTGKEYTCSENRKIIIKYA